MSRIINETELQQISGGFHLHLGSVITTLVIGFVTAGPAGLGIAASGLVMAQGIDNLNEIRNS